jgi:hypothetical protein
VVVALELDELVDADEIVVVDVDVLEDERVENELVVLVLVVVEDEVVDTDVVALDVSVDVTVVDGDVISQPWNVPASCFTTSSLSADANKPRTDSPVPRVSSLASTSRMTCTFPL